MDETADYLVVDKPPFLLAHPTKPDGRPTLWKQLRELLAFEIANGGQISIINRLDRETSGLMLVAKTAVTARRFGMLMQQQRVRKQYLAIVWGWPEWDEKIVDAPLDRQGRHQPSAIWLKQIIHPDGAPAQTRLFVERRFVRTSGRDGSPGRPSSSEKFSLVRAEPRTGRTHQIRVHLAAMGHPVVGDTTYGAPKQARGKNAVISLSRNFLHAAELEFQHPRTGDAIALKSELPELLREFLGKIEA